MECVGFRGCVGRDCLYVRRGGVEREQSVGAYESAGDLASVGDEDSFGLHSWKEKVTTLLWSIVEL